MCTWLAKNNQPAGTEMVTMARRTWFTLHAWTLSYGDDYPRNTSPPTEPLYRPSQDVDAI